MHTHGIKILDRTDDDTVILVITDHFHFILFPAENGLLQQYLVSWRCIHAAFTYLDKFLAVISDTATTATESERRADNNREPYIFLDLPCLIHIMRKSGMWHGQPDLYHGLAKTFPVLRLVNCFLRSTD